MITSSKLEYFINCLFWVDVIFSVILRFIFVIIQDMDRIVFFDIDGTLFNTKKYLNEFYELLIKKQELSEKDVKLIKEYYEQIKNEIGYFSPFLYLLRIYNKYPKLNGKLDYYFSSENIQKFLFEDSEILYEIKDVRLGIFSRGDLEYQREKIEQFKDILESDLIFVLHNKIKQLPELIETNSDSQIYIIDDVSEVLLAAKETKSSVVTILIDRDEEHDKVNGIDYKLNNLFDIITVLA